MYAKLERRDKDKSNAYLYSANGLLLACIMAILLRFNSNSIYGMNKIPDILPRILYYTNLWSINLLKYFEQPAKVLHTTILLELT